MFKNKHVVIAMLVAPLLALMAWFAVDYFVAERPHAARPGATYKLIAKSNCRYDSGECDLENADFKLSLRPLRMEGESIVLELSSRFELQSATAALVEDGREMPPVPLSPEDEGQRRWTFEMVAPSRPESALRIAVTAQNATWYAEVPLVWMVNPG